MEFEDPAFVHQPARGLESATSETFATARGVAQRNGVSGRIETDFVRSGMRTGATGTERDSTRVTAREHFLLQAKKRAGRSVFFGAVMNFPAPSLVIGMMGKAGGGFGNDLKEKIDANGKIRAVEESGISALDGFANGRKSWRGSSPWRWESASARAAGKWG